MNTTTATSTQTFTAADVAELAEMVRPHLERIAGDGMSIEDAVTAGVLMAKEQAERDMSRRLTDCRFLEILGGTYDEFRTEAQA